MMSILIVLSFVLTGCIGPSNGSEDHQTSVRFEHISNPSTTMRESAVPLELEQLRDKVPALAASLEKAKAEGHSVLTGEDAEASLEYINSRSQEADSRSSLLRLDEDYFRYVSGSE